MLLDLRSCKSFFLYKSDDSDTDDDDNNNELHDDFIQISEVDSCQLIEGIQSLLPNFASRSIEK